MKSVRLRAHAKINLILNVLDKREDGLHDIHTVFQSISLADRITVMRSDEPGIRLTCLEGEMPTANDNSMIKAANLFFQQPSVSPFGAAIKIVKKIPMQAGLGGGSSDAAAVLRALNLLTDKPLAETELIKLASLIGADAPFFLKCGTYIGEGSGSKLSKIPPLPPMPIVVVKPKDGISTAWAYSEFDKQRSGSAITSVGEIALKPDMKPGELAAISSNDFQSLAFSALPELKTLSDLLMQMGSHKPVLCGSGSAIFGLFDKPGQARTSADILRRAGYWSVYSWFADEAYCLQMGMDSA